MTYLMYALDQILVISWTAGILIMAIYLLKKLLGSRLSPRWHYYIWLLVLARLMLPAVPGSPTSVFNLLPAFDAATFHGTLQSTGSSLNSNIPAPSNSLPQSTGAVADSPPTPVKDTSGTNTHPGTRSTPPANDSPATQTAVDGWPKPLDVKAVLLYLWLSGIVCVLAVWLVSNILFYRKIRSCKQSDDAGVLSLVAQCKSILHIRNNIPVYEIESALSPCLVGIVKPKILVPRSAFHALDMHQKRYVLLHELIHLKRKDNALQLLCSVLQAIHWFNPLVWWAFARMRVDGEKACDHRVMASIGQEEATGYGHLVLDLAQYYSLSLYPVKRISGRKSKLGDRIQAIAAYNKNARYWTLAGVAVVLITAAIFLTGPWQGNAKKDPGKENPSSSATDPTKPSGSTPVSTNTDDDSDTIPESNAIHLLVDSYIENTYAPAAGMDTPFASHIILSSREQDAKTVLDIAAAYAQRSTDGIDPLGKREIHHAQVTVSRASDGSWQVEDYKVLESQEYYWRKDGSFAAEYAPYLFPPILRKIENATHPLVADQYSLQADINQNAGGVETITLQMLDTYQGQYILKIDDAEIYGAGDTIEKTFNIVDIDASDPYREIAVSEYGPSNDDYTTFYWYDGKQIYYMGAMQGFIGKASMYGMEDHTTIQLDHAGNIWARSRSNFIGTWFYPDDHMLDDKRRIVNIPQEWYDMNWKDRKVLQPVSLQKSPQDSQTVYQLQTGDHVTFVKTDNKKWVLVKTSDGKEGWLALEEDEYFRYTVGGKFIPEVFEGMPIAAD